MNLINDFDNWFETVVNPNDPSQVTMRRLSPEEAKAAYVEEWLEAMRWYFPPKIEIPVDLAAMVVETTDTPDQKQLARQRSREDVSKKRRGLWRG